LRDEHGLGRRLRELRQSRSMTLEQVSRVLNVHVSTVGKYERGERRPAVSVLVKLADLYQADLADIVRAGETVFAADVRQRLRDRPDLDGLVRVARRLSPGEVMLLTDLLRMLTDRAGAAGPAPGAAGRAAEPAPPGWASGPERREPGTLPAPGRGASPPGPDPEEGRAGAGP
jgi:transcriptional regulator with XRE-family HTH domain